MSMPTVQTSATRHLRSGTGDHDAQRALDAPPAESNDLLTFARAVYDRVPRPAERMMSRQLFDLGARTRTHIHEPAFALAPPAHTRVNLVRRHPPLALDVAERHALLHVGFRVAGRWLLAACTDSRGEAHELGVWLLPAAGADSALEREMHVARTVWAFAAAFARRASVEWRVVLAKLGLMGPAEIDGEWIC